VSPQTKNIYYFYLKKLKKVKKKKKKKIKKKKKKKNFKEICLLIFITIKSRRLKL